MFMFDFPPALYYSYYFVLCNYTFKFSYMQGFRFRFCKGGEMILSLSECVGGTVPGDGDGGMAGDVFAVNLHLLFQTKIKLMFLIHFLQLILLNQNP